MDANVRRRLVGAAVAVAACAAAILSGAWAAGAAAPALTQTAMVTPSIETSGALFGGGVALCGDLMAVAAPNEHGAKADSGAVYLFSRSAAGTWTQAQRLAPADETTLANFGYAVALSPDTLVVGASNVSGAKPFSGAVYVFTRGVTGVWAQSQKLTASNETTGGYFGCSVGISGDSIVVGSRGESSVAQIAGAAYVFTRTGGVWSQQAMLVGSDEAAFDTFGHAVAIDGDTALVCGIGDDDVVPGSGSAYVFTRTAGVWSQAAKLLASDPATNALLGDGAALSGDTAVLGATGANGNRGAAYVFTKVGGAWGERAKITSADSAAGDMLGSAVAISGSVIAVGAPSADEAGTDTGAVYAFTGSGGSWSLVGKGMASDAIVYDRLGSYLAVGPAGLATGAHGHDRPAGWDAGAVYVFGTQWPTTITIKTNATSARTGNIPILSGVVSPQELVGKNVMVMVKRPGKTYWSYSSWRTVYSRYGVPSWQYKYFFKPGMVKGVYYFYALVPNWPGFQTSKSGTVSIRLR